MEKDKMTLIIEKNVMVPMRDGVRLAANIYRLEGAGPQPVLLSRTPYDKEAMGNGDGTLDIQRAVQAGYVVMTQDTRGRFSSEGDCTPFVQEHEDGYDTIAWAANQPWSSGAVGMFGGSYVGNVQWMAACEQPPALRTIAPLIGFANLYKAFWLGGIPQLVGLIWSAAMGIEAMRRQVESGRRPAPEGPLFDGSALEKHMPLDDFPFMRGLSDYYFDWLKYSGGHPFWETIWPADGYEKASLPTLNIGGWYDCFIRDTLENYIQMRRHSSPEIRGCQRLIVGPWTHGGFSGVFAEQNFGGAASVQAIDMHGLHIRWYDRWLKGRRNGIETEKPVKIFVMGINQWRDEDDWPLPDAVEQRFYLHSGGSANSLEGDGALADTPPAASLPDMYLFNPLRLVPTRGGQVLLGGANDLGPKDQRPVERRDDVLVYTSAPLEQPLEVTGPVRLRLFASSTGLDTDFVANLVDVYPDGTAMLLTGGGLRARYRNGTDRADLLEPGAVVEMEIDLWATANVFLPGHRIRLDISSSSFPRLARNTNTGGDPNRESIEQCQPAINRVYHDSDHPSALIVQVIRRG
jgi:putative CocE/NonD family hydrolase